MNWLKKANKHKINKQIKSNVPKGIWKKCDFCKEILYIDELKENLYVCPKCEYHMKISARKRLNFFLDNEPKIEICEKFKPKDMLNFKDLKSYKDRLLVAQNKTQENEALIVFKGKLKGMIVVTAAFEFAFMGGSMGAAVGSRFVCAVKEAIKENCPLICFSTSGGARVQEGVFSLMQMAKTSAVLYKMKKKKLPYISVLTDPTMGGVSASLAMLGDLNIAEPKALIGFAGPRVIQQIIKNKLPKNFQSSEFLLENGAIDLIIKRTEMRKKLSDILKILLNKNIN